MYIIHMKKTRPHGNVISNPTCIWCLWYTYTSQRVDFRASGCEVSQRTRTFYSEKFLIFFFNGEMRISQIAVSFFHQENSLKHVTDFRSVLRKCHDGCIFFVASFSFRVVWLMRWLCQVHELSLCCHCTSAIPTGANGTRELLFFAGPVTCNIKHVCKLRACLHPPSTNSFQPLL